HQPAEQPTQLSAGVRLAELRPGLDETYVALCELHGHDRLRGGWCRSRPDRRFCIDSGLNRFSMYAWPVAVKGRKAAGRVTLADIAAELGIARSTVSNAYNRPDQLSDDLRQKILAAAARLGYAGPDPAARSLRKGVRDVIGVVYPSELSYAFADPAAALFIEGIAHEVEAAGYGLLLIGTLAP